MWSDLNLSQLLLILSAIKPYHFSIIRSYRLSWTLSTGNQDHKSRDSLTWKRDKTTLLISQSYHIIILRDRSYQLSIIICPKIILLSWITDNVYYCDFIIKTVKSRLTYHCIPIIDRQIFCLWFCSNFLHMFFKEI